MHPPPMQCDCADFEAMHKWALKIFMRSVPHGAHLTSAVIGKHMAQFLYTTPAADTKPAPLRPCRCGEDPCTHKTHVHVDMPGLREDPEDGTWHRLVGTKGHVDNRSVTKCNTARDASPELQYALRAYTAAINGVNITAQTELPAWYYTTQSMTLSWHTGLLGELDCEQVQPFGLGIIYTCDTFHT